MRSSRLREFVDAARLRGVRWAGRALVRRFLFSYRRAYLFWNPFVVSVGRGGDDSFEHRLATRDDLDRLRVFEPYVVRSRMQRWLESDGTWIFLVLDGNRPIAFECDSTAPPADPILPSIRLAKDQIWTNDLYVVPEYRRRHVSLGLRQYRNRILRTWGFGEMVSKIDEDNHGSLTRMLAVLAPSARVRRVTCLCVLGLRWWWIEEDARPLLEEHVGRSSAVDVERAD